MIADHPHTDPGDGRTECDRCGKWVWLATHSCKGVPVTDAARARHDERFRCICDPDVIFEPPDPRPVAVEGCPAHRARRVYQQHVLLITALADVCGYHQGDDCTHCADVLKHRRGLGWTDPEIIADIQLYRSDFDAWADKVRARAASRADQLAAEEER